MPEITKNTLKTKQKFKPKQYRAWDPDGTENATDGAADTTLTSESNSFSNSEIVNTVNLEERSLSVTAHGNGLTIIDIPTSDCSPWKFADRDDAEMGDIEELARSIKANGQQEPALVRISTTGDAKYEVIFGHRRWLACKLANIPLLAMIKDLSDQEAAVAQKEENENRQNLSPYSKAMSYQRLLDNKIFASQRELSANLNISKSTLNSLMSFSKLPNKLLKALENPHIIPVSTAEKLAQLCSDISEADLDKLCLIAPNITSGKIKTDKIQSTLYETQVVHDGKNVVERSLYKNNLGIKLFTSGENHNGSLSFTFHKIVKDNNLIDDLEKLVLDFLRNETEISE